MKWTKLRRETGLVEHVCEHGIGHPNLGSALWCAEKYGEADEEEDSPTMQEVHSAWLTHGCDKCCTRKDFPGTAFDSLRYAHAIIRKLNKALGELE